MPRDKAAFSFIEVITVMILIAILAVVWVAVPIAPNQLIGSAYRIMSDLRYSQHLAITRQVPCGVSFNITGNNYFVYIGNLTTKATDPLTGNPLIVNLNTASEYKGVRITKTNFGGLVYFDFLGRPYDSAGTLLTAQGVIGLATGIYTQSVTIEPNTGEVKVP
ncbi:MAG: hypothetical protein WC510_07515 [Candidatus Omnitrophota bacterium]